MRNQLRILAALAALFVLACSQTTEPQQDEGRVELRFAFAPDDATPSRDDRRITMSAVIDSVVVNVFRPGDPITLETSKSAPVTGAIVDISIPCIAESGKRVSVDLYEGGQFTHHGFTTGVNVVKGVQTPVSIDAYDFDVATLTVTPGTATEPETFDLSWEEAPAATEYRVQSSATPDFSNIQWEQTVTATSIDDVDLTPGGHYFRVVPRTPYAQGPTCPEQYAYLASLSDDLIITSLSVPAAKPLDVITIFGENLDYPGTQVSIGSAQMQILSSSWGALDVIVPRAAITESITVVSGSLDLGSDTYTQFIVQRVAYVTSGGAYTSGYVTALEKHNDDFGFSGVAVVRLPQIDQQDMTVFDIIVVAGDTGNSPINWGGNLSRANKIHDTNANVLAMGRGGAVFLDAVGATTEAYQTNTDADGRYYVQDGSAQIFSTPHSVGGGFVTFNGDKKPSTTSFDMQSPPGGITPLASTDCAGLLCIGGANQHRTLLDFRFTNGGGDAVRYFFWGYADDPEQLTSAATDILGNIMFLLYQNRTVVTPPPPVN